MKEEKSLVLKSKMKNSRIISIWKKICDCFGRKDKNINTREQSLNDLGILKEIVEGRMRIEEIENGTKKRLIELCNNRSYELEKIIEKNDVQIEAIEVFIKETEKFIKKI